MILKMNKNASREEIDHVVERIEDLNCQVHLSSGTDYTIIGLVGKTSELDEGKLSVIPGVDKVMRITSPYKLASRDMHPKNSSVKVGKEIFGGNKTVILAGPCSVESYAQVDETARYIKENGGNILRGGIVKPRTSPYAFQGLEEEGLEYMEMARQKYGLAIVCEVMTIDQVERFADRLDMLQIGSRNMQNFDLLKAVGKTNTPVLLKRGLSATIEEWLMSAEYIMSNGNMNVVLCERGIRTFETAYRNVTDLNAVPMIKRLSHLPVVVDPSHATGKVWMVKDLALASVAVGADGIMLETHYRPEIALSDGLQSLNPEQYEDTIKSITRLDDFLRNNHE